MKLLHLLSLPIIALLCNSLFAQTSELVVYTARKEHLIKPIFETYTQKTGIKIKYITGKSGALLQRLKAEGKNSPADIFLTVDAGNLWHAADAGVLKSISSKVLTENIPSSLRDPNSQWFGLSIRARTMFYNPKLIKKEQLSTYENLGTKAFHKKLCLRTSKKVYNQSLVAMMIAEHGEDKTLEIVKSWVKNLAAPSFSNDTSLLESINAGQCAVGIANTYYYGRLEKKSKVPNVKIFWPNQKTSGVHVNISGAGIVKHAPNGKEAQKFIEWMSSTDAQNMFADVNMEYPVNPKVKAAKEVQHWGTFKSNKLNLNNAGKYQVKAVQLMDKAQYK